MSHSSGPAPGVPAQQSAAARDEQSCFVRLLEDELVLVVGKAAGVLSHSAGAGVGVAVSDHVLPDDRPVHRLDRDTSGVLLLARTAEAAAALGSALQRGQMEKRYLALVQGVAHNKGIVRRSLLCEGKERQAITRFRRAGVLRLGGWRGSLLVVRPETGRQHQIRRHLAGIGHPVLGDARYGDRRVNAWARQHLGTERLLLHAAALTFPHPGDGQKRTVTAGLPDELLELFEGLDAPGRFLMRWGREPATPPALPYLAGTDSQDR